MTDEMSSNNSMMRRRVLKTLGAASIVGAIPTALREAAWAQGSDRPEKAELRIGFIPLTDCSSVVMAAVKGFDKKYGIKIIPTKEASWAAVRDKLVSGEIDMAHCLYGLVYGVHLGVGGHKKEMAVLMTLNQNGQAITLSQKPRRGRRHRRSEAAITHVREQARVHVRPDLPHRHACHVVVLLAGRA